MALQASDKKCTSDSARFSGAGRGGYTTQSDDRIQHYERAAHQRPSSHASKVIDSPPWSNFFDCLAVDELSGHSHFLIMLLGIIGWWWLRRREVSTWCPFE